MDDLPPPNAQTGSEEPDSVVAFDVTAKKLARQLNFTEFGGAVLPELPHFQSQSHSQSRCQSESPAVMVVQSPSQPKSPQHLMVLPVGTQSPHPVAVRST